MGRLPEELIKRVKAEVDLVQLIQSQGHTLTKRGKDYAMRCLWHDDKTPSLIVSPDTGAIKTDVELKYAFLIRKEQSNDCQFIER